MLSLTFLILFAVFDGGAFANVRHLDPPSVDGIARIINGEAAADGEFPHQLALYRFSLLQTCGASLIHKNWALTAAHCVDGVSTLGLTVRTPAPQDHTIQVADIILHEDYGVGPGAFPNDVALLQLVDHSFDISNDVITVASDVENLFVDDLCVISGYGMTEDGSSSTDLLKAEVEVLSKDECKVFWEDETSDNIQDQHICVMGPTFPSSAGACNGDSGGPLTCWVSGDPVLAGVTSWGRSGCHNNGVVEFPSVYARTSEFFSWIRTNCNGCV